MSRAFAVVLLLALAHGSCATRMKGEDLGGGFSRVPEQVAGAAGSDEPASFVRLHYRGADLGRVGFVSVAPSGDYALFERNGDLFLIASGTGNLRAVTDGEFSAPRDARWQEAEGFVEVDYHEDRPSSRIALATPEGP
jgi:hypothetical protein